VKHDDKRTGTEPSFQKKWGSKMQHRESRGTRHREMKEPGKNSKVRLSTKGDEGGQKKGRIGKHQAESPRGGIKGVEKG